MAPPDGLDRALRDALGSESRTEGASSATRSRLLAELRRRRARRARAIGGGVVGAVVVAGLAVTLGTSLTAGPPPQSATGAPEQRAAAGSAPGSVKRAGTSYTLHESAALDAPAGSPAAQAAPEVPCAEPELRIGSGPVTCMGTSARTVTMRVGQRLTLMLSGNRTLRWTAPAIAPATGAVSGSPTYAGASLPAGAAQSRRALAGAKAILAPVPGTAHPKGGSAGASFVARHRGAVLLYTEAATGCGRTGTEPSTACVPDLRRSSVVVIVKGN